MRRADVIEALDRCDGLPRGSAALLVDGQMFLVPLIEFVGHLRFAGRLSHEEVTIVNDRIDYEGDPFELDPYRVTVAFIKTLLADGRITEQELREAMADAIDERAN